MKYCNLKAIYLLVYHVNTLQIIRWYQITKNIDSRFFCPNLVGHSYRTRPIISSETLLPENRWKNIFKIVTYQIIWYLRAGFKNVILFSEHATWFIKCVFYKIWLVTSTRIMKYKSWVVKSNPAIFLILQRICKKIKMSIFLVYPGPLEVNYK